ncbi:MAG: response regulator transcription factor [Cyanobacteriota bacterium]|nr:response regulator transcription factor [Cyanobacteriota bacterium]
MRILLIEDDQALAGSLADALEDECYQVDVAKDGEDGWERLRAWPYELLLLDIHLPRLDGIRLCQRLRGRGFQLPVLMLTARDTSTDKITGLDAGADDYVVKPFDLQELLARIRALLRRGSLPPSRFLIWGDLKLNPSTCEASYADAPLRLTPKELALLELFLTHGRRVLSRHFMIERIWTTEESPEEETVKAHIKTLRQKLRLAGSPEDLIETVHGMGYRLKQLQMAS